MANRNDTAAGRAEIAVDAAALGAVASMDWVGPLFGPQDVGALVEAFEVFAGEVAEGETAGLQRHLAGQFLALSNVATALMRNAAKTTDAGVMASTLRLALRAQGQAAQTAKVIGELQNPGGFIGKQVNVAGEGGQQIVANGRLPRARTRGIESQPNEVSSHGQLEQGSKSSGAGAVPSAAPLEIRNGTQDGGRQGPVQQECVQGREEK